MAAPPEKVRVMKQEPAKPADDFEFPTAVNVTEDALDAHGMFLQEFGGTPDNTVWFKRDGSGNIVFKDQANAESTLADIIAGAGGLTETAHKALRQLIHFINDGPAEGFATGSFKETKPDGAVFPTTMTWYVVGSTPPDGKIVQKTITYTGVLPTTIEWKMYDVDGSTVLVTVTDTIVYQGVFETTRTRAVAP